MHDGRDVDENKENGWPVAAVTKQQRDEHQQQTHNTGDVTKRPPLNGRPEANGNDRSLDTINGRPATSRRASSTRSPSDTGRALKLSPQQIQELTSSPGSLPVRSATPVEEEIPTLTIETSVVERQAKSQDYAVQSPPVNSASSTAVEVRAKAARSTSSPTIQRKHSSHGARTRPQLPQLKLESNEWDKPIPSADPEPSPMPADLPIPPLSLPTYLQLELSSSRPSPLYIHYNPATDTPYESSEVKFQRLLNFLRLPPQLEQVLIFGTLACLDSWLYTFTILPLRFVNAMLLLLKWTVSTISTETSNIVSFVYVGLGRVWQRRRESVSGSRRPSMSVTDQSQRPAMSSRRSSAMSPEIRSPVDMSATIKRRSGYRHRRTRSSPSSLLPNHKADILQGFLIILTCLILLWLDASRMYHSIRGQAAIKLYVIYNVLEVFDRLFSALGQDVLECLFSKETLERGADGRSKILRPLSMFLLALVYNVIHATALFYQLVTLNVAVNSYSNALLTLLMSNQFVEIKGTVFKKFEKENLFQMTCADVVERFQLWLMLLIIAFRNIVEVGGFSMSFNSAPFGAEPSATTGSATANATLRSSPGGGVIPNAFTLMPSWTGEVIGPFLIVLGSEMLVDWLKHAYITKFNNVKPNIYGRFLDVLTKDYYSHAFADQNLIKRLGLPVIPLSCLFIRASVQTYHMFYTIHVAAPITTTASAVTLDLGPAVTTPATMRALQHIDMMFRSALGGSSFAGWTALNVDDVIALITMAMFFLALYLVLLACKLVLGMALLSYSRGRYRGMKLRESQSTDAKGRRLGGWGMVEVGDDKRRWIYEDDKDGLKELQAKEAKNKARAEKGEVNLDNIDRYMMAAKRIW